MYTFTFCATKFLFCVVHYTITFRSFLVLHNNLMPQIRANYSFGDILTVYFPKKDHFIFLVLALQNRLTWNRFGWTIAKWIATFFVIFCFTNTLHTTDSLCQSDREMEKIAVTYRQTCRLTDRLADGLNIPPPSRLSTLCLDIKKNVDCTWEVFAL